MRRPRNCARALGTCAFSRRRAPPCSSASGRLQFLTRAGVGRLGSERGLEMEGLGLAPAASDRGASGGAGLCSPGDSDARPVEELPLEAQARAPARRRRPEAVLPCFCFVHVAQYTSPCGVWNSPCLSEG